ncbi:hypothetical protein CAPI_03590 [Corynebacterium capitovis DSM 44611]|uniref:DUF4230 domain-containing protein n=1 Tax=Corynebacterium capitovis TaxID=131081 RepID=UPI000360F239|nr:DUF4230 domain-containing protein [Corynebacterium capitovis]WKD57278.1 hypothetical protein CAPI_03590 [Corynebacterium capitovis DSM 44611]
MTPARPGRILRYVLALLALAAVLIAALFVVRPTLFGMGKTSMTSESLGAAFNEIAELSTEEYAYSRVGSFDQRGFQIAGRTVPFTGRNFLVTYDGTVKAGIRNAELIEVRLDDTVRTLSITTPHAEVLSSTISPESINVYDQSMNPLNQVRVQDVSAFLAEQERNAENTAVEQGLLERADRRVEELLRNHGEALTEGTAMEDYAVEVNWR